MAAFPSPQSARPGRAAAAGLEPGDKQPEAELVRRIAAAQAAKNSGDPDEVASANKELIALSLRQLGQLRMLQTAYPQAVELYRHALEIASRDEAATRVDLALAEVQANHTDDAIFEANTALLSSPKDVRALTILGNAYVKKQEYSKAAEAFDRAARITPETGTLYSYAICLLQSKDARDKAHAEEVFSQMRRMAGDSGSLHVLFGRAYRDAGDMPSAVREFQRAVAIDAKTPHAHYFLALARFAVNEWKATPEIKAEFLKQLRNDPRDYLTNYMLGFIASGERQFAVSNRYLKNAIAVKADWPEPWLYLGLNANAQGDAKAAEEAFRQAIALTGADDSRSNFQIRRAYIDLGRILANSGRSQEGQLLLAKARDLQNKVLQQGQQDVASMVSAGGAGTAAAIVPLSRQSENQVEPVALGSGDASAPVDAAVVARVNFTPQQRAAAEAQERRLRAVLGLAFNDLATSEALRHQYAEALAHYQEAERWDSTIAALEKNLGLSAFRIERYPEAIHGLSAALQQNPGDSPVRAMLGAAYFGAEKYAEAVTTLSPLGVAGMRDSTVGYAWAASLVHAGELAKAGAVLKEYEKANRSADALLLSGQLWIEIGDYAQAADTFHAALQADPTLRRAHYYAGQADIRGERWAQTMRTPNTIWDLSICSDPGWTRLCAFSGRW
jgi:tetratricopeptide (TPR) repeat protein